MAKKLLSMFLVVGLVLSACGGGDSDDASADSGSDSDTSSDSGDTSSDLLFSSDFEQVCRGIPQPGGAEVGTTTGTAPGLAFGGQDPEYSQMFGVIPDDWEAEYGDEASIEWVLCLDRVSETASELCEGYENDGVEWAVQTYDATYDVSLRAATTAEVIATETIEAVADGCPMFSSYSEGDPSPIPNYERPDDAIQAFAAAHVVG